MTTLENWGHLGNQVQTQINNGPIYYGARSESSTTSFDQGLHLFNAPEIDDSLFVGRSQELQQMHEKLLPDPPHRKILVLGGSGGIGKTQLAIAYAKKFRVRHQSIFWFDATSETTLKASFKAMLFQTVLREVDKDYTDEQILAYALKWLSEKDNSRWLLIFDNHDEPKDYEISQYFPSASHGSILITTRLPDLINGAKMRLSALNSLNESLEILQTRSERDVASDPDAIKLAERLNGYPLALATAGTYLRLAPSISFGSYLRQYEAKWKVSRQPQSLPEYSQRTLYTTWELSFNRLQNENPQAVNVLKLLAYFSHQGVWYELFRAGISDDDDEAEDYDDEGDDDKDHQQHWFRELATDEFQFSETMATLASYCFLETLTQTQSYSMHICVHDWVLDGLNQAICPSLYWIAFHCVVGWLSEVGSDSFTKAICGPITPHAAWLTQERFEAAVGLEGLQEQYNGGKYIAGFLFDRGQYLACEKVFGWVLAGKEKFLGPEHENTLNTVQDLGNLYNRQGKLDLAEQMHDRALAGYEKALGPDHESTLDTVHNLGVLYERHGKFDLAEQMYDRALAGFEKALGPDHTSTLDTVNNLGVLCKRQGKLDLAEQMYDRALAGYEKALGPDHASTLDTVNNIGNLCKIQGKLDLAEQMYDRALAGFEKALGPDHTSTLDIVHNLGNLYISQGKLDPAEQMYNRALDGYHKTLGPKNSSTVLTKKCLADLYVEQNRLEKGEKMYREVVQVYQETFGHLHKKTIKVLKKLEDVLIQRGMVVEAEIIALEYPPSLADIIHLNTFTKRWVIEKDTELNRQGGYYGSILHLAAALGDQGLIELVLEHGANINLKGGEFGKDRSALHWAVKRNHISIVPILLDMKIDANLLDTFGRTPMHYAAQNGHEDIIKSLIPVTDMAIEDEDGYTALGCARDENHREAVRLLIPHWSKSDLDYEDYEDMSFKDWMIELGFWDSKNQGWTNVPVGMPLPWESSTRPSKPSPAPKPASLRISSQFSTKETLSAEPALGKKKPAPPPVPAKPSIPLRLLKKTG